MKDFIDFIVEEKEKQRMTDYRLAKNLKVAQSTVSRWLKKENPITLKDYVSICKILKLNKITIQSDETKATITFNINNYE